MTRDRNETNARIDCNKIESHEVRSDVAVCVSHNRGRTRKRGENDWGECNDSVAEGLAHQYARNFNDAMFSVMCAEMPGRTIHSDP